MEPRGGQTMLRKSHTHVKSFDAINFNDCKDTPQNRRQGYFAYQDATEYSNTMIPKFHY